MMKMVAGTRGARAIQLDVHMYIDVAERIIMKNMVDQKSRAQIGLSLLADDSPSIVSPTDVMDSSTIIANDRFCMSKLYIDTTSEKTSALTAKAAMVV